MIAAQANDRKTDPYVNPKAAMKMAADLLREVAKLDAVYHGPDVELLCRIGAMVGILSSHAEDRGHE